MQPIPDFSISRLRAIAVARWDAIGRHVEPSVDRFLATAAGRLWNGANIADVADYLVEVEIECLGIDTGDGIRERATDVVVAMRSYLDGLGKREPGAADA